MKRAKLFLSQFVSMMTTQICNNNVVYCKDLPANVKLFIHNNFPEQSIAFSEKDGTDYIIRLNDGTEVTFSQDGNWKKVDSMREDKLFSLLPVTIIASTKRLFSNANIVSINKNFKGYEVTLSNAIYLNYDRQGHMAA